MDLLQTIGYVSPPPPSPDFYKDTLKIECEKPSEPCNANLHTSAQDSTTVSLLFEPEIPSPPTQALGGSESVDGKKGPQ